LFIANGIDIKNPGFYRRKRKSINESYFDNIDSEEKAYIL
jgi:hypothetical protein